jgi:inorganic phosphate transporter, PiT family
VDVVAIVAALGLAFVLGVSDAPNASSALIVSRAAGWPVALAFSFCLHALGALVAGTAVAVTVDGLVRVGRDDVPSAYAAGALAAVAFVAAAASVGIPASASYGLLGGLIGAAAVADGAEAVRWGGLDGLRPTGTIGALVGLGLSPALGVGAAWLLRGALGRGLARGTRRLLRPMRGGIWLGAGLVALSDGVNDGQKAMGLMVGVLLATGSLHSFQIPFWSRASVALALALGTALGGGRVIRRVGKGYYRPQAIDSLAAQLSAAGVILGAGALGLPVSTSTVVTAGVVGAGANRHPRHVRWAGVIETILAWGITVPACAVLSAVLFLCARLIA